MHILKIALYLLTIAGAFFFAFWEIKLKEQLTDGALQQHESASDFGIWNDLSIKIRRERSLKNLPRRQLFKFRVIVSFKFLFVAILVVEVIFFQR